VTKRKVEPVEGVTHRELVRRAARWLLGARCKLVVINAKPWGCAEHPDAIGWTPDGESVVVECKMSVADFLADVHKRWRRIGRGMGMRKYYLVPEKLLGKVYVPHGIGLLALCGQRIRTVSEAVARQDRDWPEEMRLLVSRISNGRTLLDGKSVADAAPLFAQKEGSR